MQVSKRKIVVGALAAVCMVAACSGPPPEGASTTQTVRDEISIAAVSVDVSAIGAQAKGRALPASSAGEIAAAELKEQLIGKGRGSRAARVEVKVTSVRILGAGQAAFLGGESVMEGTVAVVDHRTGAVLMQPVEVTSGGGGWVLGGIISAATLEDPRTEMRQLAVEFADRAYVVIFGK